ncbi:hypothetical protein EVAR_53206_1 [Eumeta japonica]|uniref:Uncharacterized protein n=1 Tax=Eumeta variegata TaxID=151549 RepID=A0A4C1XFQ7_EUMVA|nr:hypothetical protein EVAR_53206_1 [Eumeta japonica]
MVLSVINEIFFPSYSRVRLRDASTWKRLTFSFRASIRPSAGRRGGVPQRLFIWKRVPRKSRVANESRTRLFEFIIRISDRGARSRSRSSCGAAERSEYRCCGECCYPALLLARKSIAASNAATQHGDAVRRCVANSIDLYKRSLRETTRVERHGPEPGYRAGGCDSRFGRMKFLVHND